MIQMAAVFDKWLGSRLEGIHTCIPASIETYDAATRKASVRPLIRLRMGAGPLVEIPVIAGVPVVFPSSAAFALTWPLVAGDGVLLLFSEASLGNWLGSPGNGPVDPEDSSRFSLTDAIAIPGLHPYSAIPSPLGTLEVASDGKVTINGHLEILP